ncbi:step II splicing factor, putative [Babesia ovis]|uniref:Step II splicing factor, putative n=1 Tax=Babesia ovis TaxID=5869 RepID=A0A9W5WW12_BABOV|nr:step II splicing factor, putative [Babesia ovis]
MWMGKIGNKSASFINHKHFHPGNRENLEKVWLAEEKHKAALKRQKEMKEKLAEEIRITELKRQLREQEEQRYKEYLLEQKPPSRYQVSQSDPKLLDGSGGLIVTKKTAETRNKARDAGVHKLVIRSRYREDVHEHGHSSIFGSYYDRYRGLWGYQCCQQVERGATCPKKHSNKYGNETILHSDLKKVTWEDEKTNNHDQKDIDHEDATTLYTTLNKHGKRKREESIMISTENLIPPKAKPKGNLSMAETLEKLKRMDALDQMSTS